MVNKNHKNLKKNSKGSRTSPDLNGDNPRPQRCDIVTISAPVPRVSKSYTARFIQEASILGSNTTPSQLTLLFALSNADPGAQAAGLFDQYRYKAVRVTIRPLQNAIGLTDITANTMVPLYSCIDYDDVTAIGSLGAILQKENVAITEPGDSIQRTFVPRMAVGAYQGTFVGYANMPPEWLDVVSNGVQHYGMKFWVPTAHASQVLLQSWDIIIEHYIEFRQHQ
jgi:hypothetical protein